MTTSAFSQQVSGPELTSITETSAWTVIRLESEQPFIVGANRYVLHVGDQVFEHSRHPEGNESILEFLVDPDEWKAIDKAAEAVLVYGLYEGNMSETGRQQHMEGLFTPIGPLTQ
jgi:hypothetical protein